MPYDAARPHQPPDESRAMPEAKIDIVLRDGTTDRQPRPSPPAPAGGEQPAARDRLRPGANPDRPWETPHAPITRVDGKATKIDGRSRGTQDEAAESERTLPRPTARPVQTTEAFDPAAEARRILQGEERRQAVQAELVKLRGAQPVLDQGLEAQRQIIARRQAEEVSLYRRAQEQGIASEVLRSREQARSNREQSALAGQSIAGAVRSISRGDIAGAAEQIGELVPAASGAARAIGSIVAPLGAATAVLAGFAFATKRVSDSLSETADRLAPFSPELAVSKANAGINQLLADLRRAQEAGPELSRLVDAQSRLSQETQDLSLKIQRALSPTLTNFTNGLTVLAQALNGNMDAIMEATKANLLFIVDMKGALGVGVEAIIKAVLAKNMVAKDPPPIIDPAMIERTRSRRSEQLLEDILEATKRPKAMGVPRVF